MLTSSTNTSYYVLLDVTKNIELKPMVEQNKARKTSSSRQGKGSAYSLRVPIEFEGRLVASVEQRLDGGVLSGVLSEERATPTAWKTPPHVWLANLPAYDFNGEPTTQPTEAMADARAIEGFIRRFGVLRGVAVADPIREKLEQGITEAEQTIHELRSKGLEKTSQVGLFAANPSVFPPDPNGLYFYENASEFTRTQALLRKAWTGDEAAIRSIEGETAGGLEVCSSVKYGISLTAKTLWSLICVLFLRDHAAGRTSVCRNPECPAPYFLKRRSTQKFCDSQTCTAYAQRQYALRWWREEGSARRSKERNKSRNRRPK
jgi:hypothetical protein